MEVVTNPMAPHTKTNVGALAVLALVGAALLSGCAGLGGADDANRAPVAKLAADQDKAYAGDEVTFDAQGSSDPDGNLTEWVFDFGDGTNLTVSDDDAARVKHAYADGGEYIATVTVVDDGTGQGLEKKSDRDAVRVAIDERYPVAATVVRSPLNTSAGATMSLPFDVDEGADRAKANLTLQNNLPAGSSVVKLRFLDASGDLIEEHSYTLNSTDPKVVEFSTMLTDVGNHTLQVVADSGAARVTGELLVIYSDSPDPEKVRDEATGST